MYVECCLSDSNLDNFPNKLTPMADNLCLVDAGYFINASFPPLLQPERKVDIILSFDYTLDTPLQVSTLGNSNLFSLIPIKCKRL